MLIILIYFLIFKIIQTLFRYNIVIIDYYNEFVWNCSCSDKVADNLVLFVYKIFIEEEYGCPKIILSDNGKKVTNKLIKSMVIFNNIIYLIILQCLQIYMILKTYKKDYIIQKQENKQKEKIE